MSRAAPVGLAIAVALGLAGSAVRAQPADSMARVGPGLARPLYAPADGGGSIAVAAFELDRRPVTNGEFLAFVAAHPRWRRDRVARLLADPRYLSHWADPLRLGNGVDPEQPVTRVSWFAAKAYCATRHKRLPTELEWELAAAAGRRGPDGSAEPGFRDGLLPRYARPTTEALDRVGRSRPNYWGLLDLHGLVWEWVLDYNGTLVSSDSRSGQDPDRLPFCGAGGLASGDKEDDAGFMRYAFRSSLSASDALRNLGFRCARDAGT